MSKKKKLIPKLRFPEFKNEDEWEIEIFENVFDRLTSKNDENNQNVLTISAQQGLVSQLDYFNKKVAAKDVTGYYLLHKGDFAYNKSYSKGYPMGAIKPLKFYDKGVVSTLYICFRAKDENTVTFFEHYFEAGLLNSEISKIAQEGGRAHGLLNVGITDFFNTRLLIPNPKEQQKIAACLSSLDELINAHDAKLETLKNHKKGLMQNLFPQEGKKVPNYRFQEFKNDGEWELKELVKVAEIITGNTPSTMESSYYGGEKMFVSPADMSDNRIVSETKTTLTELGFSKTRQIKSNSVLFVCIGSTIGKVAQNKYECATNQQINSLVALKGYSSDFLYSLLDCKSRQIASIAGNHAVPIINKTSFSAVKLPFPPSSEEQEKIASCFLTLDELITAQTEKIVQLQQHKKGLMQDLFPKMEK